MSSSHVRQSRRLEERHEDGGRHTARKGERNGLHRGSEGEINGVKRHDVERWEETAAESELNRRKCEI